MRNKNKSYIGLELSDSLLDKVKQAAKEKELSISAFIRMILLEYFK